MSVGVTTDQEQNYLKQASRGLIFN